MSNEEKDRNFLITIAIAFIFIVAILLLFVSLGKIDFLNATGTKDNENDLTERKIKLQHRHNKLQALIERKKELMLKLRNKFRWIYFWVRFVLLGICASYNILVWKLGLAKDLGALLNYNEVVLLILFALNFLFFKNLIGLKEIIDYVKNFIENRVYKKYINIEIQIEGHSEEAIYLKAEMQKIDDEIKMSSSMEHLIDKI